MLPETDKKDNNENTSMIQLEFYRKSVTVYTRRSKSLKI